VCLGSTANLTDDTGKAQLASLDKAILAIELVLVPESLLGLRNGRLRDEVTKASRFQVVTETQTTEVDELARTTSGIDGVLSLSRSVRDFDVDRDRKTSNKLVAVTKKLDTIFELANDVGITDILQSDGLGSINTTLADKANKLSNVKRRKRLAEHASLETALRRATPKHSLTTFITDTATATRTSVLTLLTTTRGLT
jgi:hypothetical protein